MLMRVPRGNQISVLTSHDVSAKPRFIIDDQPHIFRRGALRHIDAIQLFFILGQGFETAVRLDAQHHKGRQGNERCEQQFSSNRKVIEKLNESSPHSRLSYPSTSS